MHPFHLPVIRPDSPAPKQQLVTFVDANGSFALCFANDMMKGRMFDVTNVFKCVFSGVYYRRIRFCIFSCKLKKHR